MDGPDPRRLARSVSRVATLGPAGTDAHHVALQLGEVLLTESFPLAMATAFDEGIHALICAGFVARHGDQISDTWVNLHFRYTGRMEIAHAWLADTKPMCVAVNRRLAAGLAHADTLALHPSTEAFAVRFAPHARHVYVDAKPLAVALADSGGAAACIGSVDTVESCSNLEIVETFQPQMLWCLYRRSGAPQRSPIGCVAGIVPAVMAVGE